MLTRQAVAWRRLVFNSSKLIRQSEAPRPQPCRHPAGKPFAHEINPRFALVPDVGANIQKIMGRNRPQKQLANSPAKSWPHSTHRECNEADKGAPVIAIEIVGNATL